MITASGRVTTRTVHLPTYGVNTFDNVSTAGERLRQYLEDAYLEQGLGPRHGWVTDLSRRAGVKRVTLQSWWGPSAKLPKLESLVDVAAALGVTAAEIVGAMFGEPVVLEGRARAMIEEERRRTPQGQNGSPPVDGPLR